jgi:anti-sigma B factor antagonist
VRYETATDGPATVVTLLDDALEAKDAKEFRRSMEAELGGKRGVVFDLSRVRFVDSSGLGAILSCLRLIGGGGGGVRLCGLSPGVRKAVELVRMDRLVDVHETRDEAVAAMREERCALGLEG